jgi:hypothetical protein
MQGEPTGANASGSASEKVEPAQTTSRALTFSGT